MIKYSIIMPVYNVEEYLSQSLTCILHQTCKDYELILVNDCSADGSAKIAEGFCEQFALAGQSMRILSQLENRGVSAARNAGMEQASGEYILFLDPDDLYEEDLLEKIDKAVEQTPDIIVYGYTEDYYGRTGTPEYRRTFVRDDCILGREEIPAAVVELERDTMYGYPWNKAYRLQFLRQRGVQFREIAHVEDILFNIDAFEDAQRVVFVRAALYHYRNQGQVRLTGKYLPDYFDLQKTRIRAFLRQQERWGNGGERTLEAIAPFYFRSFQSAIVRELEHGTPRREIYEMARREEKEPLYQELCAYLRGGGAVARILYAPLAKGRMRSGIRRAHLLGMVKKYAPGMFAKLKQNR